MTHHTISIEHVAQLLHAVRRSGRDQGVLLARAGVSPLLLHAPLAHVSQQQLAAIIRAVRRSLRDDFLGMGCACVPLGTFEQVCRQALQAATIGQAMRTGFRIYHGLLPDFTARLRITAGLAYIALDSHVAQTGRLHYAERMFLLFTLGLASWLAARRIPIMQVDDRCVARSADAHKWFHAPIRYEQAAAGLYFDASWLALPVVQSRASLDEFLRRAPYDLLAKYQGHATLTDRIRRLLRQHLPQELPSLEQVGGQLGITPQTLRRRLREEGLGFQILKDNLRRDAAIEYLVQPDIALSDIAERLGFSETSTFHRAFKKWTSLAPGEYRRIHLAPASCER